MVQSRYYSSTAQPTTLTSGVTPTNTTVVVQATTGFPVNTPFVIALDYSTSVEELCLVTAVAGTSLTVTRAFDGTTAASHNAGAGVRHTWAGVDGNDSRTHESLTSGGGSPATVHGVTGAVVGTTDTQTLSNKTLTSPTINGGTFSGTITGGTFSGATLTSPTITGTVSGNAAYGAITTSGQTATNLAVNNSAVGSTSLTVSPIASSTADSVVINAATGLTGRLLRAQVNSVDKFQVGSDGSTTIASSLNVTGGTGLGNTNTPTNAIPLQVTGPSGLSVNLCTFLVQGIIGLPSFQIDSAGLPHMGQGLKVGGGDQFAIDNQGNVTVASTQSVTVNGTFIANGVGGFITARKTANTPRTSTTTLTADPHLTVTLAASSVYLLDGYFEFDGTFGPNTSDIKFDWTYSGTMGSMTWSPFGNAANDTGQKLASQQASPGTSIPLGTYGTGGSHTTARPFGHISTTTGGTLTLTWAQVTSNATATTMYTGSWIRLHRIA